MKILYQYIKNPKDYRANLDLANYYFEQKSFSAAVSFYLRSAEYSTDPSDTYYSLIKLHECFKQIENRDFTCETVLKLAISEIIDRPEAYILLCEKYYNKQDYLNLLTYSNLALKYFDKLIIFPYEYYLLLIYKGTASWYLGKREASKQIFLKIKNDYYNNLSEQLQKIIDNNIEWTNK